MYALSLEADKRIAFATDEEHAKEGMPLVATLPESDLYDYKYVDSEFIYDPLPQPEPPEPVETADDVLNALLGITATDEEVSGDE